MPLPWKKTKSSRISRLMADLQSPPKRGGSLVVETGFPTSLVDLFVKNRDRLKKQSKKIWQSEPQMEISRPMNATPPPPCYSMQKVNSSSGGEENMQRNVFKSTPVKELVVVEERVSDDRVVGVGVGDGDGSKKRRVLMTVMRVFLVVVLALCSKKLTIGITKSAFLLLFLEFVGTMSKARTVFDCFVGTVKVLCFYKCNKDEEEIKKFEKDSTRGFRDGNVCEASVEQIEGVDSKCVVGTSVEEIKSERENLEVESGYRRERCLDLGRKEIIFDEYEIKNEDKVDVYVCKKKQSRRASLKKFVSKKLYKRDKKCKEKEMNSGTESCYCTVEDKLAEQRNGDKEEHDGESPVKEEESCVGEEVFDESQADAKVTVVGESVEREREGNSGYLILCLVVLAGLFGGRVLALVLTVCWCLMLKLAGKLMFATGSKLKYDGGPPLYKGRFYFSLLMM